MLELGNPKACFPSQKGLFRKRKPLKTNISKGQCQREMSAKTWLPTQHSGMDL